MSVKIEVQHNWGDRYSDPKPAVMETDGETVTFRDACYLPLAEAILFVEKCTRALETARHLNGRSL